MTVLLIKKRVFINREMRCFFVYCIFPRFKTGRYDVNPFKIQYMRHGREQSHKVCMAHKIREARKLTTCAIQ